MVITKPVISNKVELPKIDNDSNQNQNLQNMIQQKFSQKNMKVYTSVGNNSREGYSAEDYSQNRSSENTPFNILRTTGNPTSVPLDGAPTHLSMSSASATNTGPPGTAAVAANSSTVAMQGPGSLTTQQSKSQLMSKNGTTNGTANSNSVRGRAAYQEDHDPNQQAQTNGGMITRGGNVLINEFLQRERRN